MMPPARASLRPRSRLVQRSPQPRATVAGLMNETRTLARFVAETRFKDLPRGLVDSCKIAVLDALGAGFVGAVQPWAQRIVSVVRSLGGTPEASVIHQDWRTDVARAALANGVLIGAFECEPLTGSHASGTVLPAALAVCQRERFDGATFLTALRSEERRVGKDDRPGWWLARS